MLYLLHEYIRGWLVAQDLYRFTQVLDRIEFRALAASGLAFLIVLAMGRKTIGFLTRKKIGDSGLSDAEVLRGHAGSKANVPTMGGILIAGAIFLSVAILSDLSRFYVMMGLVVVVWHAVLGGFDDFLKLTAKHRGSGSRQGLYAWEKLLFQLGIGVLVGWFAFHQGISAEERNTEIPAAAQARGAAVAGTSQEAQAGGRGFTYPTSPDSVLASSQPEPIPREAEVGGGKDPGVGGVDIGERDGHGGLRAGAEDTDLRHVLNLPFQRTFEPGAVVGQTLNPNLIFLSLPVFIFFATMMVAGMSNAVNITDGMDGLAAGISTAVSIGTFVLCLVAGNQGWAQYLLVPYVPEANELAILAGATAGACLGFLWWNCSPAAVFMGDTGALCLGGIIGYIAVIIRQEFVILLMSAVFLLEIGSVAIQVGCYKATKHRVHPITGVRGWRPFAIAPFHHNLHMKGMPEPKIVTRLWIVSVILVVVALASIKVR